MVVPITSESSAIRWRERACPLQSRGGFRLSRLTTADRSPPPINQPYTCFCPVPNIFVWRCLKALSSLRASAPCATCASACRRRRWRRVLRRRDRMSRRETAARAGGETGSRRNCDRDATQPRTRGFRTTKNPARGPGGFLRTVFQYQIRPDQVNRAEAPAPTARYTPPDTDRPIGRASGSRRAGSAHGAAAHRGRSGARASPGDNGPCGRISGNGSPSFPRAIQRRCRLRRGA